MNNTNNEDDDTAEYKTTHNDDDVPHNRLRAEIHRQRGHHHD